MGSSPLAELPCPSAGRGLCLGTVSLQTALPGAGGTSAPPWRRGGRGAGVQRPPAPPAGRGRTSTQTQVCRSRSPLCTRRDAALAAHVHTLPLTPGTPMRRGVGVHSELTHEAPEAERVARLLESTWGATGRARFCPTYTSSPSSSASRLCPHWGKRPGPSRPSPRCLAAPAAHEPLRQQQPGN